jgi:nucleotide-binding universal stress UspA family protein
MSVSFKTILCVTGVDDGGDALAEAIQLCENTRAHLSVMVIGIMPPPVIHHYGIMADPGWAEEIATGNARITERVKAVEKQLQQENISADVSANYCEIARIDNVVGLRAQYTDVTLIGANMSNQNGMRDKTIYGALFNSAKPIVLSPPLGLQSFNAKKIMIAWNTGLPVSRAINHTLWLMKNSDAVQIVMVDPVALSYPNVSEPGTDLAQYLARHDLKIDVQQLASGGRPVNDVLKQHAIDMSADLIVMGAFGHSRLRQLVFGGTTSAFLSDIKVPVLMAH